MKEESSFAELLAFVQSKVSTALENREISFDALFHQDGGNESVVSKAIPNVFFNYLSNIEATNNTSTGFGFGKGFDLALHILEEDANFNCKLTYNKELYQEATIARVSGHLLTILTALTDDLNLPVLKLPLLTKQEEQQILRWRFVVRW